MPKARVSKAISLLIAQRRVLEMAASGSPLPRILETLVQRIEAAFPATLCAIRLAGAASDTPGAESAQVGSPETAPANGHRPCWTAPIRSADGKVFGTLSLYSPDPCRPSARERRLILRSARLAGILLERQSLLDRVREMAHRDPLTGLYSRSRFMELLQTAKSTASPEGRTAVLFVDLDNFTLLNDTLGHKAGDELLTRVGQRLQALVPPGAALARYGGDEFAILAPGVSDERTGLSLGCELLRAMRDPFLIQGTEFFAQASVGVALDEGDDTAENLVRKAAAAMYQAKGFGNGQVAVFDAATQAVQREMLHLESHLRHALERNQLRLQYQPIVGLRTGRVVGLEALVRWEHPERGKMLPDRFIPLAETTGMIVPLGRWVLENACQQMAEWRRRIPGAHRAHISINLSPRQFLHPDLAADIAAALNRSGLDPSALQLEITESAMIHDLPSALRTMRQLQALGVRLAIDDFGTGYSSLSYLKQLRIDTLKLDRSFLQDIATDRRDRGIVEAVMQMARALGLTVVGEGIETNAQWEHLRSLGCDDGQGYLFARPLSPAEAEAVLGGPLPPVA